MGEVSLVAIVAIRVQTELFGCVSEQGAHRALPIRGIGGVVELGFARFHDFGNMVSGGGLIGHGFQGHRGFQRQPCRGLVAAGTMDSDGQADGLLVH